MLDLDSFYMQLALDEAWKFQGLTYPNPPVGAVVVKDGRPLSIAAHKEAGGPHAEVLAIKEAYFFLTKDRKILEIKDALQLHNYLLSNGKNLFNNATIYVTLEPCLHYGKTPPCSILIKNLGFKRVVIGALDIDNKAKGGANYLKQEGLEVLISIKEKEALELIEPFIFWSKKRFIFFKLAQTLNGVIKGGTISSSKSREYVHKLRDKVDLLVIGGNTVRVDRPILDARMVGGRAPDILVYSKKKIDTNLPLFGVKGRKIFVEDNFDIINDYKYVMIEGGEGMLRATKDLVNWYLWFLAPFALEKESYKFNKSVNFLKVLSIDRDLMIWSKNG